MGVTYGFYNAVVTNGVPDRSYSAKDISRLFDGIISDGILPVDDKLIVSSTIGLHVTVGKGRAWFNHTWTLNDSILTLDVETPDSQYGRIDTVIVEIDEDNRANSIYIKKGTPDSVPVHPTLENTATKHQYALADINVPRNAQTVTVTNRRGTTSTSDPYAAPYVTAVTDSFTVNDLIATMESDWTTYFNEKESYWDAQATAAITEVTSGTETYIQDFEDDMDEWMESMREAIVPSEPETYTNLYNMIVSEVVSDGWLSFYGSDWNATNKTVTIWSEHITADSNQEIMLRAVSTNASDIFNKRHLDNWNAISILPINQLGPESADSSHTGKGRIVLKIYGAIPTGSSIPITIIYRGVK